MSGDEVLSLLVWLGCAFACWGVWYWQLIRVGSLRRSRAIRIGPAVAPGLGFILTFIVLKRWASFDVRDDQQYLIYYALFGAAWAGLFACLLAPLLGLSLRDDVLERRNSAASLSLSAAVIGVTLCFAGANIGDGPGWWVVLFAAGLATSALMLLWLLVEKVGGLSETLTVERDLAAGFRASGLFLALGLTLGRGAAGDWHGAAAAVSEFGAVGWPALPIAVLAAAIERRLRPAPTAPTSPIVAYGLLPGLLYLALAVIGVVEVGRW